jgi:hypothetical protein
VKPQALKKTFRNEYSIELLIYSQKGTTPIAVGLFFSMCLCGFCIFYLSFIAFIPRLGDAAANTLFSIAAKARAA